MRSDQFSDASGTHRVQRIFAVFPEKKYCERSFGDSFILGLNYLYNNKKGFTLSVSIGTDYFRIILEAQCKNYDTVT